MGTVVNIDGIRVFVWSSDHNPPHVHVMHKGEGWEITVTIGDTARAIGIKHGAPSNRRIREAVALVAAHLEACNEEWRRCNE